VLHNPGLIGGIAHHNSTITLFLPSYLIPCISIDHADLDMYKS